MTNETVILCHICGSDAVTEVPRYPGFHRVTSDCKTWPPGGKLSVCRDCGCAQAVLDRIWHSEAKQIYEDYTIYHQSKGVEQSVFDQASGQAISRSSRLLERLRAEIALPETGRLMDIGCGNGALLRAFSELTTAWSLVGVEVNDHYRSVVENIAGVEGLFTCSPEEVPGRVHVVSLMHALEHIPSPNKFIARLWEKLEVGGLLLIQVPDCAQNPFMFLVADHASHFFVPTLRELVQSVGYEVLVATNDWVAKEITVVARKGAHERQSRDIVPDRGSALTVSSRLDWLEQQVQTARSLAKREVFGLFGTSIAATWLLAELQGDIAFFVDEDPHRIGRPFFGRPVYQPANAPADSHVFVALPPSLAADVKQRLERQGLKARFHVPGLLPSV
jgi:2-polyprenyl-3-methyl-5-hydroxy-6-metoxy-1,4-benzoquinol methylase